MQSIEKYNYDNNDSIDIDSAWENFLEDGCINNNSIFTNSNNMELVKENKVPKGTDIYISTKTKMIMINFFLLLLLEEL